MTGLFEAAAAGILVSWCLYRLVGLFLPRIPALLVAGAVGFIPFFAFPELPFYAMIMAVFAPFGLLLPILAVQSGLRDFGVPINRFATFDLIVILILYLGFISASVGVVAWDPYRYGYVPIWGGSVALLFCLYGVLRGHLGVCLASLGGQILWMMDVSSSNYFDHVSHLMIIPVITVCLIRRGLAGIWKKGDPGPEIPAG